jgi:hypothetical protein
VKLPLPTRESRPQDDMLPLVNIVFLLLIFFMLAGAVGTPDPLNVQPPQSMIDAAGDRLPAMLVVGADGRLALGREVFTLEGLAPRIDAWLAVAPPGFRSAGHRHAAGGAEAPGRDPRAADDRPGARRLICRR